jgi:hypothetical protein
MLYFTFSKKSPYKMTVNEHHTNVQQPSQKPTRPCRQTMSMVLNQSSGYCSSCPQPVRSLGPK